MCTHSLMRLGVCVQSARCCRRRHAIFHIHTTCTSRKLETSVTVGAGPRPVPPFRTFRNSVPAWTVQNVPGGTAILAPRPSRGDTPRGVAAALARTVSQYRPYHGTRPVCMPYRGSYIQGTWVPCVSPPPAGGGVAPAPTTLTPYCTIVCHRIIAMLKPAASCRDHRVSPATPKRCHIIQAPWTSLPLNPISTRLLTLPPS